MIAMGRSVALGAEARRGQTVWALLCKAALRSIDWAAGAFGIEDAEMPGERADFLVGYGALPGVSDASRTIDWARLDDFERGRVARQVFEAAPSPPPDVRR